MTRLVDATCLLCLLAALFMLGCSSSDRPPDAAAMEATHEELRQIAGVKEAMVVSTARAVDRLAREDGYLGDPAVRIPLPADVQDAMDLLRNSGMATTVEGLEVAINRAAEKAAAEAEAILVPAAESMYVQNAPKLVNGHDTAASEYFRQRTANPVEAEYLPIIQRHLEAEPGYQAWLREMAERRRLQAFLQTIDVEPFTYVTTAALDGLYDAIGDEERAIRTQPERRTTKLLQEVFGVR